MMKMLKLPVILLGALIAAFVATVAILPINIILLGALIVIFVTIVATDFPIWYSGIAGLVFLGMAKFIFTIYRTPKVDAYLK